MSGFAHKLLDEGGFLFGCSVGPIRLGNRLDGLGHQFPFDRDRHTLLFVAFPFFRFALDARELILRRRFDLGGLLGDIRVDFLFESRFVFF